MIGAIFGGIFKGIFGGIGKFMGKRVEAVEGLVQTGAEIIKDSTKDTGDTQNARAFGAPAVHDSWFDIFVDGINRLVRPVMAVTLLGAVCGWWVIDTSELDPNIWELTKWVFGFYFGQRALIKDVPQMIRAIKAAFAAK